MSDFEIGVDICLVDGWHTYSTAIRDLREIYQILPDGGVMIVHDCLPPGHETASPKFKIGEWCGVSYKAYIDFVFLNDNLDYCTVDCDYGCGIIFKNRKIQELLATANSDSEMQNNRRLSLIPVPPNDTLVKEWLSTDDDFDAAFDVFAEKKVELLRLISPQDFEDIFDINTDAPGGKGPVSYRTRWSNLFRHRP